MRSVGKSGSSQIIAGESTFGFNNATKRGGVIAITGGVVDIENSQFCNNTAEAGGVVSACISEIKVQMEMWMTLLIHSYALSMTLGKRSLLQSLSKVTVSSQH